MAEKKKLTEAEQDAFIAEWAGELGQLPSALEFTPTGFVAPWSAGLLYKQIVQQDSTLLNENGVKFVRERMMGTEGWRTFYFNQHVEAAKAIEVFDLKDPQGKPSRPQEAWVLECETGKIVNAGDLDKLADVFGPYILYEVNIVTLASNRHRHQLHMITLPSVVAAQAIQMGLDNPGFNLNELKNPDMLLTDEYQAQMIGGPDARKSDANFYTESVLWKRRAALWTALGETDAAKYQAPGTTDYSGRLSALATNAKPLARCLSAFQNKWTKPRWARVLQVNSPAMIDRIKKGNSAGNPGRVPIVVEFFDTEKDARAAVERERGDKEPAETIAVMGVGNKEPALPKEWQGQREEWVGYLGSSVGEGKTNKEIADELTAKIGEVVAWKRFLNL